MKKTQKKKKKMSPAAKKQPPKPSGPAARAKKKPPLRRDTPVDTPAVVAARERPYSVTALARPKRSSLIDRLNAGEALKPTGAAGQDALSRLSIIETLEEAYDAWVELRAEAAAVRAHYAEESARLEREGEFLLGAVRAAGNEVAPSSDSALAKSGGLGKLIAEAEEKLGRARSALEREISEQEKAYASAFDRVKTEIRDRVQRYAEGVKVHLKLSIRSVSSTRNILHLDRLSPDESVLLLFQLQGAIPTRHGFLFDDSTEDMGQSPPPLYNEDGVTDSDVRPDAKALRARVEQPGDGTLPIKGFLPIFVPNARGGSDFFRLLQRGAVMEVEMLDAASFRNILSREEAERFAGHLLRLKLAGKAELEIVAG